MRFLPVLLLCVLTATASVAPMTIKEIGLMLRSGYSSDTLRQELQKRRCADALDLANESALLKAGASTDLINDLKNGVFAVTADRLAQFQKQKQERAAQMAAADRANSTFQKELARQRAAKMLGAGSENVLYNSIRGDLVRCENGNVAPANDEAIARKKLIALYFSAHWCGPCRKFTPELISYYNKVAAQHPEFEVIFFSCDRSAGEMQSYMTGEKMPWPAVDYQKLPTKEALRRYGGSGIPCLVLIDETGKVVSDSYAGSQYLGPQKVLADLDKIFGSTDSNRVAQTH